ncbi:DUF914-domain-containing protein [Neoconidiobolus thromboides FSU 785]|nr:DUF914-domain-containing protein [Neoconidiobolus thromboides FSU 785]
MQAEDKINKVIIEEEEEEEDEYDLRIKRTGCFKEHEALQNCYFETGRDWRKCREEMQAFRTYVLVSPFRKVDRVSKLNHNEISDLWITAQKVGNVIESVYKGTSLSYVIQDGPEAGQSVNHVHIHIIPREKLDFVENDQIYDELNKVDNDSRKPRTVEEMANEAITLRNYFDMLFKINKEAIISLILGQFLSLCITTSNITTGALVDKYNIRIPTTQSFIIYLLIAIVFNFLLIKQQGYFQYTKVLKNKWKQFLILSFCDVEANFFIVKGFGYTSYLSAMLINACSTPGVVFLSYKYLNVGYYKTHLIGVGIALIGLIMLVLSDVMEGKDYQGNNKLMGDLFCIFGALLYAVSNTYEEYLLKSSSKIEILAFLGLFGVIISGIQLLCLEFYVLFTITWTFSSAGLYALFTVAVFSLYTLVPLLIELNGATFYNLSLLTADFYGLILGMIFLPVKLNKLYPFAFSLVIIGLIIYNIIPTYNRLENESNISNEIQLDNEEQPLVN